jgi:hypothetical protein
VLISAIAAMANLSRETVYQAGRGIMSGRARKLLSRRISSIRRDEVTFRRRGQQWEGEYHAIASALSAPRFAAHANSLNISTKATPEGCIGCHSSESGGAEIAMNQMFRGLEIARCNLPMLQAAWRERPALRSSFVSAAREIIAAETGTLLQ